MDISNDTTTPDDDDVVATQGANDTPPEVEPDDNETPDEAEGDETEATEEDEFIDIEKDGKTYKVPKSLESLLMFQKDYTQKTQSLSEQRKALEAQRQATEWEAETRQQLFTEEAQLHGIRQRLGQFQNMNWQAVAQQDQAQYAALRAEYDQLKDYEAGLSSHIDGRKSELHTMRQQSTAKALEAAIEHLNKPDPKYGWAGKFTQDRSRELTEFGVEMGFSVEELSSVSHPLMIKTLHLAKIGAEALKKQSASLKAKPVAQPVPQVAPGKTRAGPVNPDKLPYNEWVKWRERQIAKSQKP